MLIDKRKARELCEKYNLKTKKIKHNINVANIAKFLAEKLEEKGEQVDVDLVYSAALVHDIGYGLKSSDSTGRTHCELGNALLKKEGFEEVSEIIKKHSLQASLSESSKPKTWEEKILYYADKRERLGIKSLNERKQGYLEAFSEGEVIKKGFGLAFEIEREIFDIIGIKPEDLKKFVEIES